MRLVCPGKRWSTHLVLRSFLVNISLSVVFLLVELVTDSILGCGGSGAEGSVAILSDLLVGLLRCGGTGALERLSDVVGGVPDESYVSESCDGIIKNVVGHT